MQTKNSYSNCFNMVGCDQHHVTEEDSCPASVSETFTTEEAVVASEATLITSVTTNPSDDFVEKGEESCVIDNSSDSMEQKEDVTTVTANSNTVQKEENITEGNALITEDVPEVTTLKTFEKNNLIVNQTKVCTVHTCVFEIVIKEIIRNSF